MVGGAWLDEMLSCCAGGMDERIVCYGLVTAEGWFSEAIKGVGKIRKRSRPSSGQLKLQAGQATRGYG